MRTFMEAHDGRLELESTLGRGTCARVMFPAWRLQRDGASHASAAAELDDEALAAAHKRYIDDAPPPEEAP